MTKTTVKRTIRNYRMDRPFLERLPFLISLAVAIEITGLTKHDVRAAVADGSLRVYRRPGSRKGKYYRDDILQLIGMGREGKIGPLSPVSAERITQGSTMAATR